MTRSRLNQPPAKKGGTVIGHRGGPPIHDPYRWLERDSAEREDWVAAQHACTADSLGALAVRAPIARRFQELYGGGSFSTPIVRAGRLFFIQRGAGQSLPALYVQKRAGGDSRVLFDPNSNDDECAVELGDIYPSNDGLRLAYRLSEGGNSQMSLHLLEVDSGDPLADVIPAELNPVAHSWPSQNQVAWLPDGSGFYYSRRRRSVPAGEQRYHQKLYLHRMRENWTEDRMVFGETLRMEQLPCPQLSDDGRYLVVVVLDLSAGSASSDIHVCDLKKPSPGFVAVIEGVAAHCDVRLHGHTLLLKSNRNAPRMKLVSLDLSAGYGQTAVWQTLIPEGEYPIGRWIVAGDRLLVESIEPGGSRLRLHDRAGTCLHTVELPEFAVIEALSGNPGSRQAYFACSSWLFPMAVYRLDLQSLTRELHFQSKVPFDARRFTIKQAWCRGRDRTRIPMLLVHRNGVQTNGQHPLVLYGYGGFGVAARASFNPAIIPFLECGGIYALASVRGGGELGEQWHHAGARGNKQNSFDDFNAAARWLIASGYTNPSRLACFGWSNGGLLVNTAAQQQPQLWTAVVAGAPVADMARFHRVNSGRHWMAEYGSPEVAEDLATLLSYSPCHNMPARIQAPAVLLVAPDGDDRVAPWHAYKLLALWQAANESANPVMLLREKGAGHKGGAALAQVISRQTSIWSFLCWRLGVECR